MFLHQLFHNCFFRCVRFFNLNISVYISEKIIDVYKKNIIYLLIALLLI